VFAPPRRWRFDAAWPAALLAAECDGGQWAAGGGRHNTDADREKLNAAAALGWRVLRFSASMITDNPVGCVDAVRKALNQSDRARDTLDTLLDCGCIACRSCRDLVNVTLGRPMEDMP
jgi:very-short-patch-repair endonuclease